VLTLVSAEQVAAPHPALTLPDGSAAREPGEGTPPAIGGIIAV
jgi:hypothetical protein